jgi:hypothetical protein
MTTFIKNIARKKSAAIILLTICLAQFAMAQETEAQSYDHTSIGSSDTFSSNFPFILLAIISMGMVSGFILTRNTKQSDNGYAFDRRRTSPSNLRRHQAVLQDQKLNQLLEAYSGRISANDCAYLEEYYKKKKMDLIGSVQDMAKVRTEKQGLPASFLLCMIFLFLVMGLWLIS